MFRTRDFILVFTTICFLVLAIGVTLFSQSQQPVVNSVVVPSANTISEFSAEVPVAVEISRADRIQTMRQKIAESGDLIISESTPEPEDDEIVAGSVASSTLTDDVTIKCAGPVNGTMPAWTTEPVQFDVTSFGRTVFYETEIAQNASTSSTTIVKKVRTNLVTLPVLYLPAQVPTCPTSLVVGIGLNGTLIKNTDVSLYSFFGADTLIGYALDGFPIYGAGTEETDVCGGRQVGNQYRYELAPDRPVVLNCFSGQPVKF